MMSKKKQYAVLLCSFLFCVNAVFAAQFEGAGDETVTFQTEETDSSNNESLKKVALIIGNARYKGTFEPLANPVNDAKDMQGKLQNIGFDVTCITDVDRKEMYDGFKKFYTECQNADIALLYYSGHGVECNGENYLIPVQADIKSESDLDSDAVLLNRVVEQSLDVLGGGKGGNLIVILDACRSNPLAQTRGASRGLAVIDAAPVAGYIIAYSCRPGTSALDGEGRHSPFTSALLNHIDEPNVSFTDILGTVRGEVQEATGNKQLPSYTAEISSPLYLNGRGKVSPRRTTVTGGSATGGALYIVVIVLLCVLLIATVTLFLLLTDRGRLALSKASAGVSKAAAGVSRGVSAGKQKAQSAASAARQKFEQVKNARAQSLKVSVEEEKETKPEVIPSSVLDAVAADKTLLVAKTPVTVSQWNQVMQESGSVHGIQADFPVTEVSWFDALTFLNKLSEKDNLEPVYNLSDPDNIQVDMMKNGWRLPTKKEWLSAAGHTSASDADNCMWCADNAGGTLHACAQKEANASGLYDMFGLVWEWCSDSPLTGQRALMGGSWDSDRSWAVSRKMLSASASYKSDNTGFRGVRSI